VLNDGVVLPYSYNSISVVFHELKFKFRETDGWAVLEVVPEYERLNSLALFSVAVTSSL
jgi:hypothetical protein